MTPHKIRVNLQNITFLDRAQEFLDTYNFPVDLILDVVKHPERIEPDPAYLQAGYPIFRLRRGDLTVVLGVRTPNNPAVIFVYLHLPDHRSAKSIKSKAGGSGAPTSMRELRSWAQYVGCKLESSKSGHTKVYYNGVLLYSLPSTPHDRNILNAYKELRRLILAAKANEFSMPWREAKIKEREERKQANG